MFALPVIKHLRTNNGFHISLFFLAVQILRLSDSQRDLGGAGNLMGFISTKEITELAKIATEIAAKTMQSNGELLSKSGDESRPVSMNSRPSDIFSQGLTNLMNPARQQLSRALKESSSAANGFEQQQQLPHHSASSDRNSLLGSVSRMLGGGGLMRENNDENERPVFMKQLDAGNDGVSALTPLRNLFAPAAAAASHRAPTSVGTTSSGGGGENIAATGNALLRLANTFLGSGTSTNNAYYNYGNDFDDGISGTKQQSSSFGGGGSASGNPSGLFRLFNTGLQSGRGDKERPQHDRSGFFNSGGNGGGGTDSVINARNGGGAANRLFPSLKQLFPGADKNFGFRQGEGCLPFIGEFMKMAYGNCVKQADEKTWDTWGKELSNALMGGKIDFLRASKETCKMGAEREQCGLLRKAVSECDILGSIQLASNMQRSVSRCEEISGILDQNPATLMNQINGFLGGGGGGSGIHGGRRDNGGGGAGNHLNGLINGEMAQGFLNNFLG